MIEETEVVLHEADEPDVVADLLDTDVLPGEHGAEVDLLLVEANAPAARHRDGFVVERIVELTQAPIGPG